ncbi:MAG: hypothetical protein CVT64_04250 [Actinobacteria bacterium HGW-Actinobacteria-4]|nr:MAG: hypothetical protein CVT64_04250 [Actinobacteria bacterium HGW-Actinobacteria-4]
MEIVGFLVMLIVIGPIIGFAVYFHYRAKYRNADARYNFEHTTDAVLANLSYADDYVGEVRGVKAPWIAGRNDHTPTVRAHFVKVHAIDVDHADPPPLLTADGNPA